MRLYEKDVNDSANEELLSVNKTGATKKSLANQTHKTVINTNTSATFNKAFEAYFNSHKYIPPRAEEEFLE
mgnify:CR=1 FL=1|tara:strand:+ start:121 stop:333 length:213 start_codon:yes stop_codon:yes gene_type:complete